MATSWTTPTKSGGSNITWAEMTDTWAATSTKWEQTIVVEWTNESKS